MYAVGPFDPIFKLGGVVFLSWLQHFLWCEWVKGSRANAALADGRLDLKSAAGLQQPLALPLLFFSLVTEVIEVEDHFYIQLIDFFVM